MLDTASLNGHSRVAKVASFKMPAFVKAMLGNVTFTTLPNGWQVAILKIDPILAAAMLECRDPQHQRNLRPKSIELYQRQMETSSWSLTHQGIAFDRKGRLIDGQHRLEAAVKSGEAFPSLVWFGIGNGDEAGDIDTGANRDNRDALAFHGNHRSKAYFAILRQSRYTSSTHAGRMTNAECRQYEETYGEALTFAEKLSGNLPSAIGAALARAWYYVEPEKLQEFMSVFRLETPAVKPYQKSAITLNKFHNSGKCGVGGQIGRNELMSKSMRAILAFVNGESLNKIYEGELSAYPFPSDGKPRRT